MPKIYQNWDAGNFWWLKRSFIFVLALILVTGHVFAPVPGSTAALPNPEDALKEFQASTVTTQDTARQAVLRIQQLTNQNKELTKKLKTLGDAVNSHIVELQKMVSLPSAQTLSSRLSNCLLKFQQLLPLIEQLKNVSLDATSGTTQSTTEIRNLKKQVQQQQQMNDILRDGIEDWLVILKQIQGTGLSVRVTLNQALQILSSDLAGAFTKLQSLIQVLTSKNQSLSSELSSCKQQIGERDKLLLSQVADLRQACERREVLWQAWASKVQDFVETVPKQSMRDIKPFVVSLKQGVVQLQQVLQLQDNLINSLRQQVNTLEQQLHAQGGNENQKIAQLTGQIRESEQQVGQYKVQLNDQSGQITKLTDQIVALTAQNNALQAKAESLVSAQVQMQLLTGQNRGLQAQVDTLNMQLEAAKNAAEQQAKDLQQQLANMQKEKTDALAKLDQANIASGHTRDSDIVAGLRQQLQDYRDQIADLNNQKLSLQMQVTVLQQTQTLQSNNLQTTTALLASRAKDDSDGSDQQQQQQQSSAAIAIIGTGGGSAAPVNNTAYPQQPAMGYPNSTSNYYPQQYYPQQYPANVNYAVPANYAGAPVNSMAPTHDSRFAPVNAATQAPPGLAMANVPVNSNAVAPVSSSGNNSRMVWDLQPYIAQTEELLATANGLSERVAMLERQVGNV